MVNSIDLKANEMILITTATGRTITIKDSFGSGTDIVVCDKKEYHNVTRLETHAMYSTGEDKSPCAYETRIHLG